MTWKGLNTISTTSLKREGPSQGATGACGSKRYLGIPVRPNGTETSLQRMMERVTSPCCEERQTAHMTPLAQLFGVQHLTGPGQDLQRWNCRDLTHPCDIAKGIYARQEVEGIRGFSSPTHQSFPSDRKHPNIGQRRAAAKEWQPRVH